MMETDEPAHERLDDIEKKSGKVVDQEDMHAFPISTPTIFFQALLILAAIYYAMLLTNWGNPAVFNNTTDFY